MTERQGVRGVDRWLIRAMLRRLNDPPVRIVLWNGEEAAAPMSTPAATVVLGDRGALYRLIADPEFQFGELYTEGRLSVEGDLVALMEAVYRTQATKPRRFIPQLPRRRSSGLAGARTNIHHHYDIGTDFYRLWLGEELVYTCAYFETPDATLEAAQSAKMEYVCRKLRLRAGETVVEAGCGWGSLALHMARHHGVKVRAFNISGEQISWARERARAEGFEDRVQFIDDDYRNISGRFDAFVSVGMLEHVGPKHYRELGGVIDRCLTGNGRGLIHSIGRNRPHRPNPWITTRIFPGAYLPSLGEMIQVFEPYSFSVLDVENLRLHYAATLGHWLERFESQAERVRNMFDERFVRMWRLYLAGSVAGFATGAMQLFQLLFARSDDNEIPWTREHLYHRTA